MRSTKFVVLSPLLAALVLLSGCSNSEMQQDPRDSKYAPLLDEKYSDAVQKLDQALQANPNSLQAMYCRATVEVEGGNLEDGINRLNELLEKYPKYSFGYSERSRANFRAGKYDQAISDADLAIRYRPDVARNYVRRAMAELLEHKSDKAMKDLETASKLAPNEDPVFVKVLTGAALMDQHRYQDALPLLSETVSNAGKDVRPYVQRAICYAHLKDWKKAIADSDKAMQLQPDNVNAKVLRASLLSATGKREDARRQFMAIVKEAPDSKTFSESANLGSNVPSIADAALAAVASGQPKLARSILIKAQSQRPLDGEELFAMAKTEEALGDLFRAAKLLNECLATEPTWGAPRVELIKLYLRDNLPQKARDVQKEGLELPLSAGDRRMVASAI